MFPKSKILSPNSNLATSQTVNVVISDACKTKTDVVTNEPKSERMDKCPPEARSAESSVKQTPSNPATSTTSARSASAPLERSPPPSDNPYAYVPPLPPDSTSVNYCSPDEAQGARAFSSIKTRDVNLTQSPNNMSDKDKNDTIEFLKLLLKSYINNPIKYNGYIICTVPLLERLIELLTGCDECSVITADPEMNCCGKEISTHIVPVSKIWVKNGNDTEIFKYKYSQYLQLFEEYNVSLKLVYIE